MEREWLIIPDFYNLEKSAALAQDYGASFEYNDFFDPMVYTDLEEVKRRVHTYKMLERDRSRDTLHGVFLDISVASKDSYIKKYSQDKIEQSLAIAEDLGVKGVVFHSGLIGELQLSSYIKCWVDEQEDFLCRMLEKYPSLEIYMENTFEKTPAPLLQLKERLKDEKRFMLCLDYAHACLTSTPIKEWVFNMASSIGHLHLNDNDLNADLHMVPGEGVIDFKRFKKLMQDNHISVPILLELNGIEKQKRALEYMKML